MKHWFPSFTSKLASLYAATSEVDASVRRPEFPAGAAALVFLLGVAAWEASEGFVFENFRHGQSDHAGIVLSMLIASGVTALLLVRERALYHRLAKENEVRRRAEEILASIIGVVWENPLETVNGVRPKGFVSAYVEELLGYTAEEWLSVQDFWLQAIHPDDRGQVLAMYPEMCATGITRDVSRWITKSGQVIWLETHITVVKRDANGKPSCIRGVSIDATERKRAEAALRQSQARLAEAQRLAHMGSWEWDVSTDKTIWSDELYCIFGVDPAEFEPTSAGFWSHVHRDDLAVIRQRFEHALTRFEPFSEEFRIVRADGSVRVLHGRADFFVDEEKKSTRVIGTAQDNTGRRQSEEALRASEERFRQMAESVHEVFWMASPDRKQLLYVSPAYEKIWGRSCASIYADPKSWMETIVPEDRSSVHEAVLRSMDGTAFEVEYRITQPDGLVRWVRDRGFPVRDGCGKLVRVCGVCEDITKRKQTEEAIELANRQLQDLSRQAGMAEVATSVLHNVGNVLNSVNTSVDIASDRVGKLKTTSLLRLAAMLREHGDDLPAFFANNPQGAQLPAFLGKLAEHFTAEQQALHDELKSLRCNVEHINEIVAMQQSYATAGGVIEVRRLDDLIEDAVRMNATAFQRHGTRLVRDFDPLIPPLPLDRNKVLLILVNLLRNAKYACDDNLAEDKCITLCTRLNGNGFAKISVRDNGSGIEPEILTRIFEHGFTTRKEGHGFGLHSSALAALEMGGALRVHSDGPGRGATFTLELPLPAKTS